MQPQRRTPLVPSFDKTKKSILHRKVNACIDNHDLDRNSDFLRLREQGLVVQRKGRAPTYYSGVRSGALYIRKEVKALFPAMAKALLHFADHTFNATYLFEIKLPPVELARQCNQLQPRDDENNKRQTYEPVRRMLRTFVELGYVIEVTEWDAERRLRAASRFFITPKFFTTFGIAVSDVRELMKKRYKALTPIQRQQEMSNYNAWQQRIKRSNCIAKIRSHYLDKKLKALRAEFLEPPEPKEAPASKPVNYSTNDAATNKLEGQADNLMMRAMRMGLKTEADALYEVTLDTLPDPPDKQSSAYRHQLTQLITALTHLLS